MSVSTIVVTTSTNSSIEQILTATVRQQNISSLVINRGPTGAQGEAGPNSITSSTSSDGTGVISLGSLNTVNSIEAGDEITLNRADTGSATIFNEINGPSGPTAGSTLLQVKSTDSLGSHGSIFTAYSSSNVGLRVTESGKVYITNPSLFVSGGPATISLGGANNTNTFESQNSGADAATDYVFQAGKADRTAGELFRIDNYDQSVFTITASSGGGDVGVANDLEVGGGMTVDGNVGIGTTSPNAALDVVGNVTISGADTNLISSTSSGTALTVRRDQTNPSANLFDSYYRSGFLLDTASNNDSNLSFTKTSSGAQVLQGVNSFGNVAYDIALNPFGGNVGIGTDNPSYELDVTGAIQVDDFLIVGKGTNYSTYIGPIPTNSGYGGVWLRKDETEATSANYSFLSNGTNSYFNAPDGGHVYFRISNNDKAILNSSGNFGIGTTSPNEKLHVKDDADATLRLESGTRIVTHSAFSGDSIYTYAKGASFHFGTQDSNYLILRTNNVARLQITNGGTTQVKGSLECEAGAVIEGGLEVVDDLDVEGTITQEGEEVLARGRSMAFATMRQVIYGPKGGWDNLGSGAYTTTGAFIEINAPTATLARTTVLRPSGDADVRGRLGVDKTSGTFGSSDFGNPIRAFSMWTGVPGRFVMATDNFALGFGTHAGYGLDSTLDSIYKSAVLADNNVLIAFSCIGGDVRLHAKNGSNNYSESAVLTTLTDDRDIGSFLLESDGAGNLSLFRNEVLLGTLSTNVPNTIQGNSAAPCLGVDGTVSGHAGEVQVFNIGVNW